jgi:mannose-1-phosphate guanylyltransferase/phosphomannomutase
VRRPLSELVAEIPRPTLVHRQVQCPWALKGTVMRILNERFADREVDLMDGIKVFDERGWAQVLPDPDEPLIHVYAEGADEATSEELEEELRALVAEVVQREEIGAEA